MSDDTDTPCECDDSHTDETEGLGEIAIDESWMANDTSVLEMVERLTSGATGWVQKHQLVDLRWSGVRSCSSQSRARREVNNALNRWVKQVLQANPDWSLVDKGFDSFQYRWRNGRRWDNSRWCRGWANGVRLNAVFEAPGK